MGPTGFDSKMNVLVSKSSIEFSLVNMKTHDAKRRQQLRACGLILDRD